MERVDELAREASDRLAATGTAGDHATMLTMFFASPPHVQDDAVDEGHRRVSDARSNAA